MNKRSFDEKNNVVEFADIPEEVIKGLISALEDVKKGRYVVLCSQKSNGGTD